MCHSSANVLCLLTGNNINHRCHIWRQSVRRNDEWRVVVCISVESLYCYDSHIKVVVQMKYNNKCIKNSDAETFRRTENWKTNAEYTNNTKTDLRDGKIAISVTKVWLKVIRNGSSCGLIQLMILNYEYF